MLKVVILDNFLWKKLTKWTDVWTSHSCIYLCLANRSNLVVYRTKLTALSVDLQHLWRKQSSNYVRCSVCSDIADPELTTFSPVWRKARTSNGSLVPEVRRCCTIVKHYLTEEDDRERGGNARTTCSKCTFLCGVSRQSRPVASKQQVIN